VAGPPYYYTHTVYRRRSGSGPASTEEDEIELEIQQRDSVRWVEFPLTSGHDSKRGSQAREERIRERDG
jgi:hypothetical protein